MKAGLKWAALLSVAASLLVKFYDGNPQSEPEAPAAARTTRASDASAAARRPALTLSIPASASAVDLFPAQSWIPPQVASSPIQRPAGPPPLPFHVVGYWQANTDRVIFLLDGARLLEICARCRNAGALHPGAALSGGYQLQTIGPDYIEFTRPPGKSRQRLRINP
jgi:hypothetical protein